jgi:acyl carrier protein
MYPGAAHRQQEDAMAVDTGRLIAALQRKLVETLQLDASSESLDPHRSLVDLGAETGERLYEIDSVDLVEFVVALENELGADLIEEDDITAIDSLAAMATYLAGRVGEAELRAFCDRLA